MLEHTFLHIPGVGYTFERLLWDRDIRNWEDALQSPSSLPKARGAVDLCGELQDSVSHLEVGDGQYFHLRLPARERWRMLSDFQHRAVCLDIETTGLSYGPAFITVIGLYDGSGYKAFVRGQNLHQFASEIQRYSLVITYNGLRFDLPFIEAELGPIVGHLAHLDVMYPLRRLGYRGGLKAVEQNTGLARPSAFDGLSGYDAVLLWRLHQRGHLGSLRTLVRYNAEDVVGLLPLAAMCYNLLAKELPLDATEVEAPPRPHLDLPYDFELLEWLRDRHQET